MSPIYFKFFPRNLILKGFQYKLGNNKDTIPFNSERQCTKSGLHYTNIHNLPKYEDYGAMIGIIEIPKQVPIISMDDKYKSPEINILELYPYEEFLLREDLYLSEKKKITDINFIIRMPYLQTPEICKLAVQLSGFNLKYVC